jgi:two-component system chemotaxis sensor kinase CheA
LCGARRAVPLGAVVRIEEVDRCAVASSAGRLHVALGGRLLPLWGCDAPPQVQRFNVIRLSDGQAEGAYAAAAVLDTVELPAEATPAGTGSDIAAVALIGDEQVELVDLHLLFARSHALSPSAARPLCLLPEGDAWVDGFLRPLVESAGYATHAGIAAGEARLAIVWDDQVPEALPPSARLVRLRSREASAGAGDDSIYRYDRPALLRALGQGR